MATNDPFDLQRFVDAQDRGASAHDVFGSPYDVKVRSSMILLHRAEPERPEFRRVLDAFYSGEADPATDERL